MRTLIVGLLLTGFQAFSHADIISTYSAGEEKLILSYRDAEHIRLDRSGSGYFLINGAKAVGIVAQGDHKVVLSAEQMASVVAGINGGQSVSIPDSRDVKLTDTGTYREVAGYKGKVFQVSDGKGIYRVVLTDHAKIVAASEGLRQLIRRFATAMGKENSARILALDSVFHNHPYRGLLAVDGGMTLVSLSETLQPAGIYQVPQSTLNLSLPGLFP